MTSFEPRLIDTTRITMNVWESGPSDGTPLLLVHGNLTTGGFWKYVAERLPGDVRVIAPDMRGFGRTDPKPIDATRGLGDMVDDVRSLLEVLGLADQQVVHSAGWSMGAGILQQYALTYPDDLATITLVAPLSPFGFGGTKGDDGQLCTEDAAGTGGGGANQDFVQRLAAKDTSLGGGNSAPRTILTTFFGPQDNEQGVDLDFLLDELLTTRTGDDFYPGDASSSQNWPTMAPGTRGVLNTMAPTYYRTSAIVDLDRKPAITWVHGLTDQVVSDKSLFDLATLGELGAIPGWPGADAMPPQPMTTQMRTILATYAENGGTTREVPLEGIGHGIPLAAPQRLADEIQATMRPAR